MNVPVVQLEVPEEEAALVRQHQEELVTHLAFLQVKETLVEVVVVTKARIMVLPVAEE